ncbi:MAG: Clp protease N-terminal domain-containing protein, partial [Patescibacteria group bacterium]
MSYQFLDNLSSHLKDAIARSITLADSYGAEAVSPLHLFVALLEEEGSVGAHIIGKFDVPDEMADRVIEEHLSRSGSEKEMKRTPVKTLPFFNDAAKKILERAMLFAYEKSSKYVGTEHLLSGILHANDPDVASLVAACRIDAKKIAEHADIAIHGTGKFPNLDEMSGILE